MTGSMMLSHPSRRVEMVPSLSKMACVTFMRGGTAPTTSISVSPW